MQSGFPFKKKIEDRGYTPDYGGDGRYVYALCSGGGFCVVVIDSDLLDADNWLGDSQWIVNPVIDTIELPLTQSYRAILYVSRRKELWCLNHNQQIAIIDCDPESASFHTVIRTQASPFTGVAQEAFCYAEKYNAIIRRAGDQVTNVWVQIREDGSSFTETTIQPFQVSLRMHGMSFNNGRSILVGGEYFGGGSVNTFQVQKINANKLMQTDFGFRITGLAQVDEDYIYLSNGTLQIRSIVDYSFIANISTASRTCLGATCYHIPRFITSDVNVANTFAGVINKETLTLQNSISFNALRYANQVGIATWCCAEKNGIFLGMARTTDATHRDRVFLFDLRDNGVRSLDLGRTFVMQTTAFLNYWATNRLWT